MRRTRVDIRKVLGTETEFGITVLNQADFNPVLASSAVINSYAGDGRARIQWSLDEESPGRDARGFGALRGPGGYRVGTGQHGAHERRPFLRRSRASRVLRAGGCRPPSAALYDKAGEVIMARAVAAAQRLLGPEGERLVVYKNNSDGKGNSYGAHENYLMAREQSRSERSCDISPGSS